MIFPLKEPIDANISMNSIIECFFKTSRNLLEVHAVPKYFSIKWDRFANENVNVGKRLKVSFFCRG